MASYSNILLPTMNNRDRFIVLIDALPNLGPLGDAFFQVSLRRRVVNGFTSNDPVFIVNFLAQLGQRLASVINRVASGSVSGVRASTVVLDRRGNGSVVTAKELSYWSTQAYLDLMARKARQGWSYEQRNASANVARRAAELATNKIPYQFKPRAKLMLGEEPMLTLQRDPNIGRWFLGEPMGLDNQIYNTRLYYAQAAAANDPMYPADAKRNIWRLEGKVLESLNRVLPVFEQLKLVQIAQRGPAGANPGTAMLGAQHRLGKAIAEFMDDRYRVTDMIEFVIQSRINFMLPAELDNVVLDGIGRLIGDEWERVNVRGVPPPAPAPAATWQRMRMNVAKNLPAATRLGNMGAPLSVGGEAVSPH
jgi:hypothetical protein